MPRGTTLRNVRIDDDRWNALRERAAEQGSDASKVIRDLIDEWLRPMHWYRVLGGMIHEVPDISVALRSTADRARVTCPTCLAALSEDPA